jgi:hypothetical protein
MAASLNISILILQRTVLQLTHHTTSTLNKIQSITSIYLLHVSAQGCLLQEYFQTKGIQARLFILGIQISFFFYGATTLADSWPSQQYPFICDGPGLVQPTQ